MQRSAEEEWRSNIEKKEILLRRLQRQAVPVWQRVFALLNSEGRVGKEEEDGEMGEEGVVESQERREQRLHLLRLQLLLERNFREQSEQEASLLQECLPTETAKNAKTKYLSPLRLER